MSARLPPRAFRVGDQEILVDVRRPPRARRITLRVDAARRAVTLSLPPHVELRAGLAFLEEKRVWLETRLATLPPSVAFADGGVIPIFGVDHVIRHRPDARRGVWCEDGVLHVSGDADHVARRVRDWLKAEARRVLAAEARAMAARIGRSATAVSVRDTRSRWGSCTADGRLSFSWRLILAPRHVFDYVVAHEVAHLAELNHGPRFWRLVGTLCEEVEASRRWLRRHGARLHGYGAEE